MAPIEVKRRRCGDDDIVAVAEGCRETWVRELERRLGHKTLKVESLKEALERSRSKDRSCDRARTAGQSQIL
jgi:hypothetical protein